jgi:hypothetical protein
MDASYMRKRYKNTIKELGKSDSTKDRIFAYYLDKDRIKLTAKEEEIRTRWSACFSLLCQYHSPQQAVNVLQQRFEISEAQAYRDVKNATELFGDVTSSDKQAYRHILFEFAMKIFQLAATKSDLSEMNKSLNTMVKIRGLDRDDPDLPDFSLLQNNIYNINLEQNQLTMLQNIIKSGVIDVDSIYGSDQTTKE